MGFWLAEDGYEDHGADDFDETLHIISGRLYVTYEGQAFLAKPGDTVMVHWGRSMRVAVHEIANVFFFVIEWQIRMGMRLWCVG